MRDKLSLSIIPGLFGVCRLNSKAEIPAWAAGEKLISITRTEDELSIVCAEERIPANAKAERGWNAFKVKGPLDFSLTGVLSELLTPLADAGISIFAISTYDTDYLLVKEEQFEKALSILSALSRFDIESF
jgi:uncharacterized protein